MDNNYTGFSTVLDPLNEEITRYDFQTSPNPNITYNNITQNEELMHCEPLRLPPLLIFSGVIGFSVICLNLVVIISIVCGGPRFFKPMYWLIVHISFSDTLMGFMLLWHYCLASILNINNTVQSLTVVHGIWMTSLLTSLLGVFYLALDRYMQVLQRNLHRIYFNRLTVGFAIFIAWAIPVTVCMVAPFTTLKSTLTCADFCTCERRGGFMSCPPASRCSQIIPPFTKPLILFAAIYVLVCMFLTICVYTLLYTMTKWNTRNVNHRRMRQREIRLIKTLFIIITVFIISITPSIVVVIMDYCSTEKDDSLIKTFLYTASLSELNSLANPILYVWRIPAIRKSVCRQMSRITSCETSITVPSATVRSRKASQSETQLGSQLHNAKMHKLKRKTENSTWKRFMERTSFKQDYSFSADESTPDLQYNRVKNHNGNHRVSTRSLQLSSQRLSSPHLSPRLKRGDFKASFSSTNSFDQSQEISGLITPKAAFTSTPNTERTQWKGSDIEAVSLNNTSTTDLER